MFEVAFGILIIPILLFAICLVTVGVCVVIGTPFLAAIVVFEKLGKLSKQNLRWLR